MQPSQVFDKGHLNPAIQSAMESVNAAISKAANDPQRPHFHFGPPANWMNDPNGTIFADGYYQLFYQHNPYGDMWGHMHWGHARSRDLVHWEHLPIALWPSLELGEEHVFSGCATVTGDGTPVLFYTKVGPATGDSRPDNEQWAALGDNEWINWKKHPQNPIFSLKTHGGPTFEGEWRDPFIFHAGGRIFLILGGNFDQTAGVALYESLDPSLSNWQYRGLLLSASRDDVGLWECPNFVQIGDDWLFLSSPYRPVAYQVGDFDLESLTFSAETHGVLDPGNTPGVTNAHYYATNIIHAPDGRIILLGWIRGFPAGQGWNGCLALPRELTIGPDRRPRQNPVSELMQLRAREIDAQTPILPMALPQWPTILATALANTLEIDLSLKLASSTTVTVQLRAGNSREPSLAVHYDGVNLSIGATSALFTLAEGEVMRLRLFVDHSVTELYVNDGSLVISLVQAMPTTYLDLELLAVGADAELIDLHVWEIMPTR